MKVSQGSSSGCESAMAWGCERKQGQGSNVFASPPSMSAKCSNILRVPTAHWCTNYSNCTQKLTKYHLQVTTTFPKCWGKKAKVNTKCNVTVSVTACLRLRIEWGYFIWWYQGIKLSRKHLRDRKNTNNLEYRHECFILRIILSVYAT